MTRGRSPTPRGVTTTYAYNLRDQVTGMTYSDGTPAVTMSYDAAGRPLEIGNAVATDAYAYDDAGQLAVETQGTRDGLIVLNREMERQACLRSISRVGIESDEVMPPKDDMLTKGEIGIIRAWIDRGAKFDPPGAAQK